LIIKDYLETIENFLIIDIWILDIKSKTLNWSLVTNKFMK